MTELANSQTKDQAPSNVSEPVENELVSSAFASMTLAMKQHEEVSRYLAEVGVSDLCRAKDRM